MDLQLDLHFGLPIQQNIVAEFAKNRKWFFKVMFLKNGTIDLKSERSFDRECFKEFIHTILIDVNLVVKN